MLVRTVLAPERGDDAELCERGLAAKHIEQLLVLVSSQPMLGDERRRDRRIARTGFDVLDALSVLLHVGGFFRTALGTASGAARDVARRASFMEIIVGELLVPE